MTQKERVTTSKFLSYVLRHRPDGIGVELDSAGWVSVDVLLVKAAEHGREITYEAMLEVVPTNDKQRFELSDDGAMIRARQGHSVPVELGYEPVEPPARLYHGTAEHHLASIRATGLRRGRRHHVHLSTDRELMLKVGERHGRPVLIGVDSARMYADRFVFFRTGNGVWLTERVPADYIVGIDERGDV